MGRLSRVAADFEVFQELEESQPGRRARATLRGVVPQPKIAGKSSRDMTSPKGAGSARGGGSPPKAPSSPAGSRGSRSEESNKHARRNVSTSKRRTMTTSS